MRIEKLKYRIKAQFLITIEEPGFRTEDLVQVLTAMPKSTILVGFKANELRLDSLMTEYEFHFYHSLLKDGSEIEWDWERGININEKQVASIS